MASSTSTSPATNEIRRRGRRRLIGAIAIAVALVVFVPMILDPEPRRPRNEPVLEIPAKENAPALPPPATSTPAAKAAPAPAAPPAVEPQKPAPSAKPGTPAKAPAQPQVAATPKLEGFAVQVGAFKDEEKLKQAREKLAAAGIKHYIERRDSASGELTRLRAGPFPTREAAESALAAVKLTSLDGQVVPLP
jgi:DedD protein